MKRIIVLAALALAVIPLEARAAVTTRMELRKPDGALIPCGGSISGIGTVIVKGFATSSNQNGVTQRFRRGYRPGGVSEDWYTAPFSFVPGGNVETQIAEFAQDLNRSFSTHKFEFGPTSGTPTCTITATSIPTPSEGTTTPRPPGNPPVDQFRFTLTQYGTTQTVPCGGSANFGRTRFKIEALSDVAGYHTFHWHVERPSGNGPDQDGNPANKRHWEENVGGVWVPANTWTDVTGLTAFNVDNGLQTIHAAEGKPGGGSFELFCSYTET